MKNPVSLSRTETDGQPMRSCSARSSTVEGVYVRLRADGGDNAEPVDAITPTAVDVDELLNVEILKSSSRLGVRLPFPCVRAQRTAKARRTGHGVVSREACVRSGFFRAPFLLAVTVRRTKHVVRRIVSSTLRRRVRSAPNVTR